jgi:hypothetical protein
MTGRVEVDGAADRSGSRRSRTGPLVAVAVAALGAGIVFDVTGPRADAAGEGSTIPSPPLEIDTVESRTFEEILPGFEGRLVAAVTQPGSALLLTWRPDDTAPVRTKLGPLTDLRFDAEGTWLAGSMAGPGGGKLWFGRTGGGIFPLDKRIQGYAWHDTAPAHLAYVAGAGDGGGLHVADLLIGGTRLVSDDAPAGGLERWGDWGFGFGGPAHHTVLLLGDGRTLEIGGVPVGELADGRVAFSPLATAGASVPRSLRAFTLDPRTGSIDYPGWARPGEDVRAVEGSPDGTRLAVHLVVGQGAGARPVVRIADPSGNVHRELEGVSAHPAMAWDRSGRLLIVAVEGDTGTAVAVIDVAGGDQVILAVPAGVGAVIQDLVVLDR